MAMQRTIDVMEGPRLGAAGDACTQCGVPLAQDQRYCLACGHRRGGPRVDYADLLVADERDRAARPDPLVAATVAPAAVRPVAVATGVGVLLLAMGVGVMIGRAGHGGSTSAAPQVITVAPSGAAPSTASTPAPAGQAVTEDWPSGKQGYTVQLQALPKDGTQAAAVAAAKSSASAKGAADVGVLDSDAHGSLGPGRYVVYSGVFASSAAAKKALGGLRKQFPRAKVVKVADAGAAGGAARTKATPPPVSKAELQKQSNLTPDQVQKQSKAKPKTTVTPGAAPPVDKSKPAGGGSGAVDIK